MFTDAIKNIFMAENLKSIVNLEFLEALNSFFAELMDKKSSRG